MPDRKYDRSKFPKNWKTSYFKDEDLMKVFLSIKESSKSVKDIQEDTGIPIRTIRKKLFMLKQKDLIQDI